MIRRLPVARSRNWAMRRARVTRSWRKRSTPLKRWTVRSVASTNGARIQLRRDAVFKQADRLRGGIGVIVLGIILLILGFIASIPILWTIGIILVVIGVVLELLGMAGRAVGGRRHYY